MYLEKSPFDKGKKKSSLGTWDIPHQSKSTCSECWKMSVSKDVCTTATKFKAFTSWRLLPCNFRTWRRPQFSMPSTCARWLKEQSRWMREGASQRPLVLINWLWSTINCWRFFSDSRPPENSRFKTRWNINLLSFKY